MELSIIVPIRNGEKYLGSCIESILSQTFSRFELILVNNGSVDRSNEIIEKYKKHDARIRSFNTSGKKVNEVRKIGLENAQGDYIGFVDCDDTIEKNMYEQLLGYAIENELDIVSSGMIREFVKENRSESFDDTLPEGIYDKDGLRKHIYPYMLYRPPFYTYGIQPSIWNKIYKKEILLDVFKDLDMSIIFGEDATVVYASLLKASRVGLIRKGYYHYKIHEASNTLTPQPEFLESSYYLHYQLKKTFEDDPQKDVLLNQLKYFTISTSFFNLDRLFDINIYSMGEWYMPFGSMIIDKNVVLWGAGDVGKDFYRQLGCLERINCLLWVDGDIRKQNEFTQAPSILKEMKIDFIIIAVANERVKDSILYEIEKMKLVNTEILWSKYEKRNFI